MLPEKINLEGDAYKRFFGGGAEEWDRRGRFQLYLMQHLGLKPEHYFLDVGCGPLCGGEHLISYLDKGHYIGVDRHVDLVTIAYKIVEEKGLEDKRPVLGVVKDWKFFHTTPIDYALAFSIPKSPTDRDPYVYIFESDVDVQFCQ